MRSFTLLLAGVLALCGTLPAAQPPEPDFPILGGSLGQTMRIAITADGRAGCTAVAGFRNSLGQPPEPEKTLMLAPGQTGFVDLSLNRLAARIGQRVEVRPFVQVAAGQCDGSVEVFEVFTGRTTASLRLFTGLQAPPEPDTPGLQAPPEPEFPALGAVRGQMVRLGAARSQSTPATPGLAAPPEPGLPGSAGVHRRQWQRGGTAKANRPGAGPVRLRGSGSGEGARSGGRSRYHSARTAFGGRQHGRLPGIGSGVRATYRLDQCGRAGQVRKHAKRAASGFRILRVPSDFAGKFLGNKPSI